MKCVVFDIDGTLADVKHRLHYLDRDPKDWVAFHDAMVEDEPITAIQFVARNLYNRADDELARVALLIVSARHEDYRFHTSKWLMNHFIPHDKLYMRANDDRRPDHEVKEDILAKILDDGYEPFLVVDDRPEVCDMWRRYGITVLQADYEESTPYRGDSHSRAMTLLVGPAGAGKSTWCAKNALPGDVISSDRIREENGFGHTQEDLARTFKLMRGYAKARIACGLEAVIDATNLKQKDRMAFVRLVPKSAMIRYVLIDRDYDEKVRDRGWRPVDLIDKHHRQFQAALPDLKGCDGQPNVYIEDLRG